jgi:hypothetical protein
LFGTGDGAGISDDDDDDDDNGGGGGEASSTWTAAVGHSGSKPQHCKAHATNGFLMRRVGPIPAPHLRAKKSQSPSKSLESPRPRREGSTCMPRKHHSTFRGDVALTIASFPLLLSLLLLLLLFLSLLLVLLVLLVAPLLLLSLHLLSVAKKLSQTPNSRSAEAAGRC